VFVKICGLTDTEAVAAAVEAGADAVGFVFAPSPREIEPDVARRLADAVPAHVARVAVMRHPAQALVDRVGAEFAPDWLQTDAEDLAALVVEPGIRVVPVYRNGQVPAAVAPGGRLLFEGPQSGSGQAADWDEARQLARRFELILAGGLDAENVARAVRAVDPWGVDVSSGVERARGRKDPQKIYDFVARVRALETRHA
jgi:phosphoribosylanthranilate isomerase